mmetsp:Transcript_19336/g.46100  ORF Transcript_19336/g.46100 Transcript_19336/m.46100 type:complete len:450 (-) Transcript_19336:2070-3419(-)
MLRSVTMWLSCSGSSSSSSIPASSRPFMDDTAMARMKANDIDLLRLSLGDLVWSKALAACARLLPASSAVCGRAFGVVGARFGVLAVECSLLAAAAGDIGCRSAGGGRARPCERDSRGSRGGDSGSAWRVRCPCMDGRRGCAPCCFGLGVLLWLLPSSPLWVRIRFRATACRSGSSLGPAAAAAPATGSNALSVPLPGLSGCECSDRWRRRFPAMSTAVLSDMGVTASPQLKRASCWRLGRAEVGSAWCGSCRCERGRGPSTGCRRSGPVPGRLGTSTAGGTGRISLVERLPEILLPPPAASLSGGRAPWRSPGEATSGWRLEASPSPAMKLPSCPSIRFGSDGNSASGSCDGCLLHCLPPFLLMVSCQIFSRICMRSRGFDSQTSSSLCSIMTWLSLISSSSLSSSSPSPSPSSVAPPSLCEPPSDPPSSSSEKLSLLLPPASAPSPS